MKLFMVIHTIRGEYGKSGLWSDLIVYRTLKEALKNKSYQNIPPNFDRDTFVRDFDSKKSFKIWMDAWQPKDLKILIKMCKKDGTYVSRSERKKYHMHW